MPGTFINEKIVFDCVKSEDGIRVVVDREGGYCPCCEQRIQLYEIKLGWRETRALIRFYQMPDSQDRFIHLWDICKSDPQAASVFAKLAWWGFIVEKPNEDAEWKRSSGFWMLTQLGAQFVERKIDAAQYAYRYNRQTWGFGKDRIMIDDALKAKFDYSALMKHTRDSFWNDHYDHT